MARYYLYDEENAMYCEVSQEEYESADGDGYVDDSE